MFAGLGGETLKSPKSVGAAVTDMFSVPVFTRVATCGALGTPTVPVNLKLLPGEAKLALAAAFACALVVPRMAALIATTIIALRRTVFAGLL